MRCTPSHIESRRLSNNSPPVSALSPVPATATVVVRCAARDQTSPAANHA